MTGVRLVPEFRTTSTVVTVTGVLTLATYPRLRDGVLKFATDAPGCLIADIRGLDVTDAKLLSVFSAIATRISDWPGVSFALVSDRAGHRAGLKEQAVDRFVAVHPGVATAEAARDRVPRRRAVRQLAPSVAASRAARRFVGEVCAEWAVPGYAADAKLIATELVENAVQHTESSPLLRLELRRGVFSVAVSDDDPRPAVLRERLGALEPGLGLRLVAQTARIWGCSRSWGGGKVVWAVLARHAGGRGGG
ncbi:ATP-binding protein [Amycolatopsis balhimycina DSM 5908]|uniref:ATP-binding protein n=1 Tax=Amycolatopsis balhimycina DSM 5908 TaxID=1081091 RepID=A0A428W3I2_AMYBA|nr:ATP-binding protein [Amycolatopsis balhimycina]RSM37629.1 ATP-binding protein [Amycolatopsis balhimycina DSM 5908]